MARCQCDELLAPAAKKCIREDDERAGVLLRDAAKAASISIRAHGAWRNENRIAFGSISLITGYHRRDVAHEALHRLKELVEVAVAVEVDLEGIEVRRFAVAQ
jgi:hypothetical protein